jgi:manganese oxidase
MDPSGNGNGIVLIPNPPLPSAVRHRTFRFDDNGQPDTNDPITTYANGGRWGIRTDNGGGEGETLTADYGRVSSAPGFATSEIWTLQGGSGWDHPIHIHFEEGQILSRNGNRPSPAESGRKDVYRLRPNGTVVLQMQFRDWGGMFMEHCHNTMHEDNAMLLRWEINAGQPFLTPLPTPISKPTGVTFQSPDEILPNS